MGNGTSLTNVTQNITNSLATSFSVQTAEDLVSRTELCGPQIMSDESDTSTSCKIENCAIPSVIDVLGDRYVKYVPKLYGSQENGVTTWWFPSDFCQSRLGDRKIGSNACTLIVVILAYRIHDQGIIIKGKIEKPLSRQLISALAESIVDGNEIHQHLKEMGKLTDINLTLPEAMRFYEQAQREWELNRPNNYCQRLVEWRSNLLMEASIKPHLFEALHQGIMQWESQQPTTCSNLYIILITGGRSVLLVFQRHLRKLTLIDSHGHLQHGAVVSQVYIDHLENLCDWYDDLCKSYFQCNSGCFEISFLYFECQRN